MIRRGDIWIIDFGSPGDRPSGQAAGLRPAVIVSRDAFNASAAPFVLVVPGTTAQRGAPAHVAAEPSETGLRQRTFFQPELLTPVEKTQLHHTVGRLSRVTLRELETRLTSFLDLD